MATTAPTSLPVIHLDTLSFVGLERSHLRSAVYRRVFGDDAGPVRIGRYSLLERVGSGARGVVFKAFDNQLDRLVALKVLSARADDHEELIREAKALARLSHPNVLPVYEVGETEEGQVFLATEYVKGWTLRGWYDEETRGEAAIVEVIQQVARGVQAAHDEGLVHRDLKPANILLGEDGRARVADFGLARFDPTALEPAAGIPRDGLATTTAGTPGYMAPELFRGGAASAASDQYALAVTLHELLLGALPDERDPRPGPRGVTRALMSAVRRGLSKAPEDRFPTVGLFADSLAPEARSAWRRKIPWVVGVAALGGTVALAGVAGTVMPPQPSTAPSPGSEVAMLRAQAALPEDPLAAIGELRKAQDFTDPRLLPTAERAFALGPEQARFPLPENTDDVLLLAGVLLLKDTDGGLEVHHLDREGLHPLDANAIGFNRPSEESLPMYMPFFDEIRLWDMAGLAAVDPWALRDYDRSDPSVAFSGDGLRIARVHGDPAAVSVEDVTTGEELWRQEQPDRAFSSVSLDARGERVAWTERDGVAFVLELKTGVIHEIDRAAAEVLFEPSTDSVVVLGRHSGVFRADLADGQTIRLFEEDGVFGELEVSPGGEWVAATRRGEEITVTNLHASLPRTVPGDAFKFSPDGHRMAVRNGKDLEVHDLASADIRRFRLPDSIETFAFSDPQTLWAVGSDHVIRRFEVPPTLALRGHSASIADIALSEDGSLAVSVARDYTVRVWDVETGSGRVLAKLDAEPRTVMLDEQEGRVALTHFRSPTELYEVETGKSLGQLPQSNSRPVLGPHHAVIGAGTDGLWSELDGETTMLTTDSCETATATETWVAAVCGDDDRRLHVWSGPTHTSIPVDAQVFGSSLHAWPDANHIFYHGLQERLFEVDNGQIQIRDSPGMLDGLPPYKASIATNAAHDLIAQKPDGLYALWTAESNPVLLVGANVGRVQAISGDGLHVAYSVGRNQIVVRERPVSKARPRLEAALQTAAATEAEH